MRSRTGATTPLPALILLVVLLFPFSRSARGQDCAALADLQIEDTNLLSATVVGA